MEKSMKIVEQLSDPGVWEEYRDYKVRAGHISSVDLETLEGYMKEQRYLPIVELVKRGECFRPPRKKLINKLHKNKKRVVYLFDADENAVLKLMTYLLLRKYDKIFAPSLYSFRGNISVKTAITAFTTGRKTDSKYAYKADISNYFNSVDVEQLLMVLKQVLSEDAEIYDFISALLRSPYVYEEGELISEEKGIMAGCPLAAFLANVYLSDLDWYFYGQGILYGRYSDDIILFADSEQEVKQYASHIRQTIGEKHLVINPDKENFFEPHQPWNFLGMVYCDGVVDISPVSAEKLKQKMKRKSKALLRWKRAKGIDNECAVKAFIRIFNQKLYDNPIETEMTWTRWYFPIINTTKTLEELDHYMQDCIRYIATEKWNKGRFRYSYGEMKRMGYRSLVNAYYKGENGNKTLQNNAL